MNPRPTWRPWSPPSCSRSTSADLRTSVRQCCWWSNGPKRPCASRTGRTSWGSVASSSKVRPRTSRRIPSSSSHSWVVAPRHNPRRTDGSRDDGFTSRRLHDVTTTSATIVVCDGDETGQELLEESLRAMTPELLGVDLNFVNYDLSLANRRKTNNDVVREAAAAMVEAGLGLK